MAVRSTKQEGLLNITPYIISILFFLIGCTHKQNESNSQTNKIAPTSNLTFEEAQSRFSSIQNPSYILNFFFEKKKLSFLADETISFELTNTQSIFLDFKGGQIKSLLVNAQPSDYQYDGTRIYLPSRQLIVGKNSVQIQYSQTFSKNGRGIYRFEDPADQKEFIWSKLEPFDANHVFPCFDQPDLKASFKTTVTAPKEWIVVFTTLESKKTIQSDFQKWEFPESAKISTYLFSIHAGNYFIWKNQYKNIPLRLLSRPSLSKYVNHQFWFEITKKGFEFYEKEFDHPYPFHKFDQLLVPEFSTGGMENVAAVNYNERHIKRGLYTEEDNETLASIILHEMAHMWFGDLVTNKWWDELWLNESFATFMSYHALTNNTKFKSAWSTFGRKGKYNAYIEDLYPTTHPVSTSVPDIASTFNHFDSITYSKGASSIRQLNKWIGPEKFRAGIQKYFKEHAFQNTTLKEFVSALEKSSNQDLSSWTQSWLKTSGTDRLRYQIECSNDRQTQLTTHLESLVKNNTIRPHKLEAVFFEVKNKSAKQLFKQEFELSKETQVVNLNSKVCPNFVLWNYDDADYLRFQVNQSDLINYPIIQKYLDPTAKVVFWVNSYLSVRDGTLSIISFNNFVLSQLKMPQPQGIELLLEKIWQEMITYFDSDDLRINLQTQLEKYFLNQIIKSKNSALAKFYFELWIPNIELKSSQEEAIGLTKNANINWMDQDLRWKVWIRLSALGHPNGLSFAKDEYEKDPTETGFKKWHSAQAAVPSFNNKINWLTKIKTELSSWSLSRKQSVIGSLFPETNLHQKLKSQFAPTYFETLDWLTKSQAELGLQRSFSQLAPTDCSQASIDQLIAFSARPDITPDLKHNLLGFISENEICLRIKNSSQLK